jgi:twitching motility protein PilT
VSGGNAFYSVDANGADCQLPAASGQLARSTMTTLPELLRKVVELEGSDLHITTETPPQIRVHGHLERVDGAPMTASETKQLTYSVLTDAQKKRFEETLELDFSFGIKGLARFRCNMFNQRGAVAAVYRLIPETIRGFQELNLPPVLATLAERPRGLVLVTGPTGSGKSTTLAAMIDKINKERKDHILTIEDPIEFVHQHQGCLVNQREVHSDTQSFSMALRAALREDPDIVLIGEMRDLETVEAALRIAETGHLTFGTLHTNSAAQTINRIIDIFPSSQQSQIRTQLSLVLEGIVCQALLPKIGGGRIASLEIMIPTPAIRNLIREDKIHQIYSAMQTGQEKLGMQTANQSLATLYMKKQITLEHALNASSNRDELQEMINRGVGVVAGAGLGRAGAPLRPVAR